MRRDRLRWVTGLALSTSSVFIAMVPAQAAQATSQTQTGSGDSASDTAGVPNIIVTARRQNESLQKAPVAITAISAASIERANVQQVDKIAQLAPNLVIQPVSAYTGAAAVFIRGIGESDTSLTADSRVGVYLDGVYVARQAGALFDLVDIERIEVLRGPQGTLFGRNTTGGAIQIISRKPADEFGVTVKGSYGRYDDWTMRGRLDTGKLGNLPLAASLSYVHRQRDGYFNSTGLSGKNDPGSLNTDAITAALKADLGNLQVDYSYDRNAQKGAPGFSQYACFFGAPGCAAPNAALGQVNTYEYFSRSEALGGAPLLFAGPDERIRGGGYQSAPGGEYRNHSLAQGHTLTAEWKLSPAFNLKSITGYRKLSVMAVGGLSQGGLVGDVVDFSAPTLHSIQPVLTFDAYDLDPQRSKQFSQEFQLSGDAGDLHYLLGGYYFREKVSYNEAQPLTLVLTPEQLTYLGFPAYVGDTLASEGVDLIGYNTEPVQAYRQTATSKGVYAQLSWKPKALDEQLEITGGLRYTKDRKRLALNNSVDGVPNASNTSGSMTDDNASFLLSAAYQLRPTTLLYGKVSTGYKSGGFNPAANGLCDVPVAADETCPTGYKLNSFKPEKLTAYEIGAKMDMFNRKLRLNIAAFYTRYNDLQVSQFLAGSGGAASTIVNAGKADYKGVEVEATLVPTRGLTLSGSAGYTDAKYKQFLFRDPYTDELANIANAARFTNLAKFNSNVSVDYEFPETDYGTLALRLAYSYRSRIYFFVNDAVSPFNKNISSAPTNTVDARIALHDIPLGNRAKSEIALVGENLLNEDQRQFGLDFGSLGFANSVYGMNRRVSVQVRITY